MRVQQMLCSPRNKARHGEAACPCCSDFRPSDTDQARRLVKRRERRGWRIEAATEALEARAEAA